MADVSVATVSNVLGARKTVNPLLVARVHAAVETLGYRVDRAAAQLRSGKTRIIAVLVPALDNPFFTSIIAAIEQAVQSDGYDIIVASSNNDAGTERRRLATLLSWRPAGVVVMPVDDAFAASDLLEAAEPAFVVVDRLPPRLSADTVSVDNEQAAILACDHLIALGHRDILVVASTLRLANIRKRFSGIRKACRDGGLPDPKVLEVGLTLEAVALDLADWLAANERPTGIIALTNFTTIGVIASLAQAGIRIPRDLSLVGFDDYIWMQAATPSITAIRQPVEQLGLQAWNCLRERIQDGRQKRKAMRLRCTLQVRGSTSRVPVLPHAPPPVSRPARRVRAPAPAIIIHKQNQGT